MFVTGAVQRVHDLLVFGKPLGRELGKDKLSVDRNFETTSCGRTQFKLADVALEMNEQFLRQTDGTLFVVSGGAVLDGDGHRESPFLLVCDARAAR
jgi:hypothetical protein